MTRFRTETSIQSRDPDVPLTDDQIRHVVPSAFAFEPHESRSARFTVVPTADVMIALRREGFYPFYAAQSRARDADRREHTKHLLRFRTLNSRMSAIGDVFNEVVVLNASDGTSAYDMSVGVFRLICLNGAVVADSTIQGIRVRHTGNIVDRVLEGAHTIVSSFPRVSDLIARFRARRMPEPERHAFARLALEARYGNPDEAPVTTHQVLSRRRIADMSDDLWTVFNVVQENLLRGGLQYRADSRNLRTRAIGGLQRNVDLNRMLWQVAERFIDEGR